MKWVSVKERMPDVGNGLLLINSIDEYDAGVLVAFRVKDGFSNALYGADDFIEEKYVTHWAFLPELPKD